MTHNVVATLGDYRILDGDFVTQLQVLVDGEYIIVSSTQRDWKRVYGTIERWLTVELNKSVDNLVSVEQQIERLQKRRSLLIKGINQKKKALK